MAEAPSLLALLTRADRLGGDDAGLAAAVARAERAVLGEHAARQELKAAIRELETALHEATALSSRRDTPVTRSMSSATSNGARRLPDRICER